MYIVPAAQTDIPCNEGNTVGLCHPQRPMRRYPNVFDRLGVRYLAQPDSPDLVLMDELGTLENEAQAFQAAVMARLDGHVPVLVIKPKSAPLLDVIRRHGDIHLLEVTRDNRTALFDVLDRLLCQTLRIPVDGLQQV